MNYVVLSSDKNFDYAFYASIVSLAWQRRGYRPLLLLIGSAKSWLADPRLRLALQRSREAGAVIHFVPEVEGVRTSTVAQCARIFGALAPGVDADDFLLTSDIDMLPLGPWVGGNRGNDLTVWYANAYDQKEYPHWPICYVGGEARRWRDMLGLRISLTNALKYMLAEAPSDVNGAWNWDERWLGNRIAAYGPHRVQFIPRTFVKGEWRIDRSDWDGALAQVLKRGSLDGVADAHLPRPGFGAGWEKIAPLLRLAFSPDDFAWCEEYHERWMEAK